VHDVWSVNTDALYLEEGEGADLFDPAIGVRVHVEADA
jgi:hypothetical protein